MSDVRAIVEWRRTSYAVWMSPPPPCVRVAATRRRSRKVIGGRSVVAQMRRKVPETISGWS